MNSGNHVMLLGDLITWMFEYIGGIQPDLAQPGFKHIIMNPRIPAGLTFARAEHHCPYGPIISDWKLDGSTFIWNITVPANTTATLYVPAASAANVTESGQPAHKTDGVKFLSMENDRAIFEIGSGSYKFISNSK
jgi:alpha-L-rhamnosidase